VHRLIAQSYNWKAVARQVEQVYREVVDTPFPSRRVSIANYFTAGNVSGLLMLFFMVWIWVLHSLLWDVPAASL
jgi:hypothetical protein